jgi:hypothetical protein
MAKKKVVYIECKLCVNSVLSEEDELHCITRMKDTRVYEASSKVCKFLECDYYKEKGK